MAETRKQELIERILQLGDSLLRQMLPEVPRELLKLDLTMHQLKVVLLLFLNGAARMSVIASSMGVSLATTTGIVDRLVERDMVQRESHPQDRRVVLCRLSDEGEKMVGKLWQSSRQRAIELMDAMDEPKLELAIATMEAVLETEMPQRGEPAEED